MKGTSLPLAVSVALSVAAICTVANAQTAASAAPSAGSAEPAGLEEIIVTANRREESVQKSSLAISVLQGSDLTAAGVSHVSDLQVALPGMSVSQSGTATDAFIRVVGTFGTDANAESAIAFNINGVYIARPSGIGPIFYDLERVEVLKGPQGTLYGMNASGGALNIIAHRPSHAFGADLTLDIGDFDRVMGTAAVNLPVGDKFALRLAGQAVDRDGYLGVYNDQHSQAGRLTALWTPTDALNMVVTTEYTHVGGKGFGPAKRALNSPLPSDAWSDPTLPINQPPSSAFTFLPPPATGTVVANDGFVDMTVKAASVELNYDFGGATLTFIPAFRKLDSSQLSYSPAFIFEQSETSDEQTYELRIGHQSDRLKWVLGTYYFDEDQTQNFNVVFAPFQYGINDVTLGGKAYAAFGEATFSLTSRWRAIAGLRYTHVDKRQDGTQTAILPLPPPGVSPVTPTYGRRTDEKTNYKVGTEFDVAERSMLYATVATGFKAGGFFPWVAAPDNTYQPENLTAYTLGSRNRFVDNRLQLNLEAFYWDYSNKTERYFGATPTGTDGLLTTNAGKATLYGLETDLLFQATETDTITLTATYNQSKYDSFVYQGFVAQSPVGADPRSSGCVLGVATPVPGGSTQSVDCSGRPLVRAPLWSGSAGYKHVFRLGGDYKLVAGADLQVASSQYLTADFIQSGRDDGYVVYDVDVQLEKGSTWSLQAWGRNLSNEAIYTGGLRYPVTLPGGDPTLFYADIRPPRTYGLTFAYHL